MCVHAQLRDDSLEILAKKKPAETGSEFLLRGMSYPRLRLGSQCVN